MNKNTFHTFHLYTCLKCGRILIFSFFYSPFYYIHITCRCWYDNIIDIKDFLKLNKCIRTRNHIENISFCKNHITEKIFFIVIIVVVLFVQNVRSMVALQFLLKILKWEKNT